MSNFLDIISHAKKLGSALKDIPTSEIEALALKLEKILENRKASEAEEQAQAEEHMKKVAAFKQQMLENGISVEELTAVSEKAPRKKREPRPAMYEITVKGERITWAGQGRMPNAFKNSGKPIEKFLIK
jgi:DNA-binding protein H-NS